MKNKSKRTNKMPPFFMAFDKYGRYTMLKIEEISHIRTIGKNREVAIGMRNGYEFKFSSALIQELFSLAFPNEDSNLELAEDAFAIIKEKFSNPNSFIG